MKIDGRCHCGYVSFEAEADPETTTICNCTDCQAMSGAPLRAVITTRPGTFVLLSGEPTEYRKTAESGAVRPQGFCQRCGTAIYSTSVGDDPASIPVLVGPFDHITCYETNKAHAKAVVSYTDNFFDQPQTIKVDGPAQFICTGAQKTCLQGCPGITDR